MFVHVLIPRRKKKYNRYLVKRWKNGREIVCWFSNGIFRTRCAVLSSSIFFLFLVSVSRGRRDATLDVHHQIKLYSQKKKTLLLRQHILLLVNSPAHDWVTTLLAISDGPLVNNNSKVTKQRKEYRKHLISEERDSLILLFSF